MQARAPNPPLLEAADPENVCPVNVLRNRVGESGRREKASKCVWSGDALPACHSAQRRGGDGGRRGRRRITGMDRKAGVVLWGAIVPSVWHRRRIYGGSFGAGGPPARIGVARAGSLSRYSRHHRPSGGSCGGFGRGAHRVGARRRGCGWGLRRSIRAPSGKANNELVLCPPHRPTHRTAWPASACVIL
jgi:hypothetical protein